jgi:hypothetical protein
MTAASNEVVAVIQADRDEANAMGQIFARQFAQQGLHLTFAVTDDGPLVQAFARHRIAHSDPRPVAEGLREGLTDLFWLIVREPGMVPDRKGPWPHRDTAKVMREFIAARPRAFIDVLTIGPDGTPDVQHGPEALQMADARSMSIGSKHNVRVRAAAEDALATHSPAPMAGEVATGEDRAFIFDLLEALKPHFPEIAFCFARGTGGVERQDILAILDGQKPATDVGEAFDLDGLKKLWRTGVETGRILQDADGHADEGVALNLLRSREMQAIGAAISNCNWHDLESAYNQGRDRLDGILTARKLRERQA